MPLGDGTGPNGLGAMTGRGAGFCTGSNNPGYLNPLGKSGVKQRNQKQHWPVLLLTGLISGGVYLAYRLQNRKDK